MNRLFLSLLSMGLFFAAESTFMLRASTVTLTLADCDLMATISNRAPEVGWVGSQTHFQHLLGKLNTLFLVGSVEASVSNAILLRFDFSRIPKGRHVVRAELILPIEGVRMAAPLRQSSGVKLVMRKLKQPWGVGASYAYRMTYPEILKWDQPGAKSEGIDVVADITGEASILQGKTEVAFNVLEDVELWFSGELPNLGWILSTQVPGDAVSLAYPFTSPEKWRLSITYDR